MGGPGALNVQSGSDAVKTIPSYGDSGHNIHQDQPELVIEAIRQVVVGVRLTLRLVGRNRHYRARGPMSRCIDACSGGLIWKLFRGYLYLWIFRT